MRNAVLIVVAVAVLAAGFVLAQSGGDDEASSARVATSEVTATATQPSATPSTETATAESAPAAPKPKPAIPTVEFADGEAKGGVKELAFEKGDQVRFRVRSDVADEIHVHGFDKYADVEAGKSVTIAFEARFDGAFEVEMHGTGTQVASLVIQP